MFGFWLLAAIAAGAGAQGTPRIPTLFLIGNLPDTSVQATSVQDAFAPGRIHLEMSSAGGMTTRQYLRSGAWSAVLARMQPGDFAVLDFGPDSLTAQNRADAVRTLAGFGDGTFDYLDPGTSRIELVHSYGWYLRRMVVEVINHGGSPLLCAGPANLQNPGPADWARYIATEQRIPLVPLGTGGTGFVSGLHTLAADPLAPFLQPPTNAPATQTQ